jgi:magnesium-transporting ATPase (P-type)
MATGDNLLTAYAVGKKCGIIDPDITAYLGDLK